MSNKKKGIFGKIISAFGDAFEWLGDLFESASKKMWENLPKEEQENLKNGSQLISIVNEHLDETPEAIVAAIKETSIGDDIEKVYEVYKEICIQFNLKPVSDTIEGVIEAIQNYLKSKEGTIWESISSTLAQIATSVLSGGKLSQAIISALIEFVYTKVKKD